MIGIWNKGYYCIANKSYYNNYSLLISTNEVINNKFIQTNKILTTYLKTVYLYLLLK